MTARKMDGGPVRPPVVPRLIPIADLKIEHKRLSAPDNNAMRETRPMFHGKTCACFVCQCINERETSVATCLLCGRWLNPARLRMVEMTTDGCIVFPGDGTMVSVPNSQGGFPVGPDCYAKVRRYAKEAK